MNDLIQPPVPFFTEAGAGPGVVCLHANGSSSRQWQPLMEMLAPRFHVLAVDSFGSGKSPAWPKGRTRSLRDEIALLEPVFARAGRRFALVAHSYGAAMALIAALDRPDRVSALALYEPTLFGLLDTQSPPPNDADEIRGALAGAAAAVDAGDPDAAGRLFVDYWAGDGAWDRMSEAARGHVIATIHNIRGWTKACFSEPTPLRAFSWIGAPVLYMVGRNSPAPTRAIAKLLRQALPRVEMAELEGVGHMGPITHPEAVNEAISGFLERTSPSLHPPLPARALHWRTSAGGW